MRPIDNAILPAARIFADEKSPERGPAGMNRREMFGAIAGGLALAVPAAGTAAFAQASAPGKATPLAIFNPRSFGADGDGKTMDSSAINAAIDACTQAGGGVVYLSPGTYLCGTVILKSNVTLYLEAGATILGSTRIEDYRPSGSDKKKHPKHSGTSLLHRHLIFARDADNVRLAGPGRINGQGHAFWYKKAHPRVLTEEIRWESAIHNLWGFIGRPSPMVEFQNVTNLRIEDVRLEEAPGWTMRPFNCTHVFIHGIVIQNPVYGPNTDGIDITGCQDVMVSDCVIDTGDDAICLKSQDVDGMECRVTRNIVVTNCILTGCCNGFKIGTRTEGGFENITFSNSVLYNDDVGFTSRLICGICLGMVDGGWVDGIVITGIQMRRVRCPINIRLGDRSRNRPHSQQGMRNIMIDGIHASDAILTSSITGIPGKELEDIRLSNIDIGTAYIGKKEWLKQPVPEIPSAYPQARMFGWLPASGLYCRHVKGFGLRNVSFRAPADEWRPTMICDTVDHLTIRGFETTSIQDGVPPIELRDVQNAWVSETAAPSGSRAALTVAGSSCGDILVSGCDLRDTTEPVEFESGAAPNVVRAEFNAGAKQSI